MLNDSTVVNGGASQASNVNTIAYKKQNQKYQIDIIFDNLQGNRFQLNLASLISLDIEEDSRYWFKRAALVIKNPDNIFERKVNSTDLINTYYKFRNDGRDIVYVVVKPVEDNTIKNTSLQLDYDVWGMAYTFSIYNKEEIPGPTSKQKQLKLYLWEYDYQLLAETNLPWSTNEVLKQKNTNLVPAYATDEQKLVNTGNAIKHLINKALEGHTNPGPVFSKEWDVGSSKIFLTTPTNYTAADMLDYLLKKHVSAQIGSNSGADPCILSRTRYTKQWKLISYSNFFSKAVDNKSSNGQATAGELQREIITLSGQSGEQINEYLFKLPNTPSQSINRPYTNYSNPITSTIKNIQFVDMAAVDNTNELVSTPCYSNDLKLKQFSLDFKDNDIENVKKYVNDNYASKFKISSNPDTLITLNKQKKDALSLNNVYSYSSNKINRLAESRNFLLTSSLFYNSSVSFTACGSLIREASTFFSIETENGGQNDEFANKLLGQWMIYKVIHRFTSTDYDNDVLALRLHANDNVDIKSDIT